MKNITKIGYNKEYHKNYYIKNRERILIRTREDHRKNSGRRKEDYYKNIEKYRLLNKQQYIKHREERCLKQKLYRRQKPDLVRLSDKKTYYKYKKHRDISPYGSYEHISKLQDSSYNCKFAKYLDMNNLYYIPEFTPFKATRKFRVDFFIPSMNLCIDINSVWWHIIKENRINSDKAKREFFESAGYIFMVLDGDRLFKSNEKIEVILDSKYLGREWWQTCLAYGNQNG